MAHDGKFGFIVFELELPYSVVERYAVNRSAPDAMVGAVGRAMNILTKIPQTPVDYHHRPDNDPSRKAETLE